MGPAGIVFKAYDSRGIQRASRRFAHSSMDRRAIAHILVPWASMAQQAGPLAPRPQKADCMAFLSWITGRRAGTAITIAKNWAGPRLRGDGSFPIEIAGESHHQRDLERLAGGRTRAGADRRCNATLVFENPGLHARRAIRIDIDGCAVGYLKRPDAVRYRLEMQKAGLSGQTAACGAKLVGGRLRGPRGHGKFEVKLDLCLPIEQRS